MTPNHALEPTATGGLCRLAVPSSLRASAAAQRERWSAARHGAAEYTAANQIELRSLPNGDY